MIPFRVLKTRRVDSRAGDDVGGRGSWFVKSVVNMSRRRARLGDGVCECDEQSWTRRDERSSIIICTA